jgi:hypothetical protein
MPFEVFWRSLDDKFLEYMTEKKSKNHPLIELCETLPVEEEQPVVVEQVVGEKEEADDLLTGEVRPEPLSEFEEPPISPRTPRLRGTTGAQQKVRLDTPHTIGREDRLTQSVQRWPEARKTGILRSTPGKENEIMWAFPLKFSREIDNSEVVRRLETAHSLETLLNDVRGVA